MSCAQKGIEYMKGVSQETNIFRHCQVAMSFKCTRFHDTFPKVCLLICRSKLLEYWTGKTDTACTGREVPVGQNGRFLGGRLGKLTRIETEDIPVFTDGGMEYSVTCH